MATCIHDQLKEKIHQACADGGLTADQEGEINSVLTDEVVDEAIEKAANATALMIDAFADALGVSPNLLIALMKK